MKAVENSCTSETESVPAQQVTPSCYSG